MSFALRPHRAADRRLRSCPPLTGRCGAPRAPDGPVWSRHRSASRGTPGPRARRSRPTPHRSPHRVGAAPRRPTAQWLAEPDRRGRRAAGSARRRPPRRGPRRARTGSSSATDDTTTTTGLRGVLDAQLGHLVGRLAGGVGGERQRVAATGRGRAPVNTVKRQGHVRLWLGAQVASSISWSTSSSATSPSGSTTQARPPLADDPRRARRSARPGRVGRPSVIPRCAHRPVVDAHRRVPPIGPSATAVATISRYRRRRCEHCGASPSDPASRRSWRALEDAGHEPAVVVGRPDPRPVPLGRPRRSGTPRVHDPVRLLGHRAPRAARRAGRRPGVHALPRRGPRRAARATSTAPRWFQARDGHAAAPGRLLLPRVRHRRGAPPVLRRPRRARRRPPEGGQRPRRAARRRRALLPARLLPPGARPPTAGSRSATPTSTRYAHGAHPLRRRPRRRSTSPAQPLRRPGVAGRRRPRAAVPARRRHRREPRRAPRRSPTGSTAATSSTGCARRSSSASAACGPSRRSASTPQVFHTNEGHAGFLGLERIRRAIVDDGPDVPRGGRGGARRVHLHHPHARCRPASTASPAS